MRRGVPHLRVSGKGEKTRYLPRHPGTNELIHDYLGAAGHGADDPAARSILAEGRLCLRLLDAGGRAQSRGHLRSDRRRPLCAQSRNQIWQKGRF